MVFVPFRDRPVLEHIVEQHAEEAAFLWTLRDAATDAPHYKRHHLARLDERVEAHVDGLRVAGEAGWRIALEQLERRCENGELFAAGVLALESGEMRRIEPLVARAAEAEPAVRRGFVGAIAWCPTERLAQLVQRWASSANGFERYLTLSACSVHRAEPGPVLIDCIEDDDVRPRARALRLVGELGKADLLDMCRRHIADTCIDARYRASLSVALVGDRDIALQSLQQLALNDSLAAPDALEVAIRVAGIEAGTHFIRELQHDPSASRQAVLALGHLGDPAAVPGLIERMSERGLERIAGEAFALITGADLAKEDMKATDPSAHQENYEDSVAVEPDEQLPRPVPGQVSAWWQDHRSRFQPNKRYLLGRPVGEDAAVYAWQEGYQRQRRSAAFELCLSAPAQRLRSWRARIHQG